MAYQPGDTGTVKEAFTEKTISQELKTDVDRFIDANRLHKFATYNYVLTLSGLSRTQLDNPKSILKDPAHDIIARTGGIGDAEEFANSNIQFGTGYGKKFEAEGSDDFARTLKIKREVGATAEQYNKTLKKNRDIYFERVEIDSYPRPNADRKLMNYTKIEMTMSEPNGITFWEKIRAAAFNGGYLDHTDAPFLLTIEFKGYDSKGDPVLDAVQKRFLPIRLTQSSLQMNAGGTTYTLTAQPWTEFAMVNTFLYTRGQGKMSGRGNDLRSYLNDFQNTLNTIMKSEVKRGVREYEDVYKITADPDIGDTGSTSIQAGTGDYSNKFKSTGFFGNKDLHSMTFRKGTSIAKILEDFVKQFPQYSEIDKICDIYWNQVQASTAYDEADGSAPTPWVPWFKIITTVKVEKEFDTTLKSHKRTIHYHVQPYKIHVGNFARAGMGGYDTWNQYVKKKYNYIYTGENLDILDLNVEYNASYYQSKLIDGGSAQGNNDLSPSLFKKVIQYFGKRTYPEPGLPLKQNVTTSKGEDPEQVGLEVGLQAQQFYDYLTNPKGDMVNVDMKIMGDPAFLGQDFALPMTDPGFGGSYDKKIQVGGVKGFEFDTEKGCFNFDNAEPVVSLDFKFPTDFDEGTGLYEFTKGDTPQFTGIYRVNRVVSVMETGQFTQNLEMTRFNNQKGSSKAVKQELKELKTASQLPPPIEDNVA